MAHVRVSFLLIFALVGGLGLSAGAVSGVEAPTTTILPEERRTTTTRKPKPTTTTKKPWGISMEQNNCNICLLQCVTRDDRNSSVVRSSSNGRPRDSHTLQEGLHMFPAPTRRDTFYDPKLQFNLRGLPACQHSTGDFRDILSATERLLAFYKSNIQQFDRRQDGGVGLILLKNQISEILNNQHKAALFDQNTTALLTRMLATTEAVQPQMFEYSLKAETDPVRVRDLENLLNRPSLMNAPDAWLSYDRINANLRLYEFETIGNEKEIIYPSLDFQCLAALADDCAVPTVCKKMYLEEPYSQYMLLHQVLYLQVAKARECTEQRAAVFGDWTTLRDRFCTKAYLEAEYLASHEFPVRFRDLFSEQVAFCSMAGYSNFMRGDWLREILSWQSQTEGVGCYPDIYGETRTTDAIVQAKYVDSNGEVRNEDCLMHFSSVSLAALSMNLRYIVDNCPTSFYSNAFNV